ncbi:ATP-binding protein [Streptomyces sp. NPDC048275]|uniref:ATP-binding protein n=1 Tax=Streptomyces sp. NPDC048275 TaxID=3155629 RepID=UPI0033E3B0E8
MSDIRTERLPEPSPHDAESGRGLLLVAGLADAWGVTPRRNAPEETIWAEVYRPPTKS